MKVLLFCSLLLLVISCQQNANTNANSPRGKKAAMIAGSSEKMALQMYPDSTFIYNNGKKEFAGHWHRHKDGFLLFEGETNGNPVIKISHLTAEVYNSDYDGAKKIELKEYDPPQIVE